MALQIATNPDTGASVALVGNEWQPIEQTAVNPAGAKAYLVGNQWLLGETVAPPPAAAPTALAAAPAKLTPQQMEQATKPTPYKNRREMMDDVVNLLEEGADPKKIREQIEASGAKWEDVVKFGQARGSEFFKAQPIPQGRGTEPYIPGEVSAIPETEFLGPSTLRDAAGANKLLGPVGALGALAASPEPRKWVGEAVGNLFKRVDANVGDMATSYLSQSGAFDVDATGRMLAKNAKQRAAAAPSSSIRAGMEAIGRTKTYGSAISAMANNPRATFTMLAESLATTLPAMAPAMVLGPAGAVTRGAVAGTTSFGMEYGSTMADVLSDYEVDMLNANEVAEALKNPEIIAKIKSQGLKRGIPIAVLDGLTMGFAGRFLAPAKALIAEGKLAGSAAKKATLAAWGKELSMQVAGGAGGEFVGQKLAGQNKPADVLLEGLAEMATAPLEARANLREASVAQSQAQQKTAARDAAVSRLAELTEVGKGTPEKTVANPDGTTTTVPATEGRFFTPEESEEYKALTAELAPKPPAPKVDTDIYGRTDPRWDVDVTPAIEAARDRAARISAEADRLETAGYPASTALNVATRRIDEQVKAESAKLAVVIPEGRVEEIAQDLIAAGTPPNEARIEARQLAQEEAESDAEAQRVSPTTKEVEPTLEGAPSATRPIAEPDRTGADLSGQPSTDVPAAEGVAGTEPSGVVSARPDAAVAATGEGLAPRTVAEILAGTETSEDRLKAAEEESRAADAVYAAREAKIAEAEDVGRNAARIAFDTAGDYEAGLEADRGFGLGLGSIDSQRDNIDPTLVEMGIATRQNESSGLLSDAAHRAFDAEIERLKAPPTTTPTETPAGTETKPETRGRKAVVKTEEQVTADKAGKAHVARTNRAFEAASSRLTSTGQGERNQAIKTLLRLQREVHKGSALGKRITAALETTNEADRARAQLEFDAQNKKPLASAAATVVNVGPVDAKFSGATNGTQAVSIVAKTGNAFLRFVANRLRPYLAGVKFTVIEEGDALPAILQKPYNKVVWENARGLFVSDPRTGERMVFVRGASFGAAQGVNNITVIHELIHAATNKRISLGNFAISIGQQDSKLQGFMRELNALKNRAEAEFERQLGRGKVSPELEALIMGTGDLNAEGDIEFSIFSSPDEFVAYGMSDPVFQKFLNTIEGKRKDESGFSAFTNNIRDLLGMGKTEATAFSDLIDITDKVLDTALTPAMRETAQSRKDALAPKEKPLAQSLPPDFDEALARAEDEGTKTALRTAREMKRDRLKAERVVAESQGAELVKNAGYLQRLRDPTQAVVLARAAWKKMTSVQRGTMARLPTFSFLGDWVATEIPQIKQASVLVNEMLGMSRVLMEDSEQKIRAVRNAYKADKTLALKLETLVPQTTLAEYDPSDPTNKVRDVEFDNRYKALGAKGQAIYKLIRDHYVDRGDLFTALLDEQIKNITGLTAEVKANLASVIRKTFEQTKLIKPFFPLVRDEGQFWLAVGTGAKKQFYIAEDANQRDAIAADIAKTMKRSVAELQSDGTFEVGNNLNAMRKSATNSSQLLTSIFDAIDNIKPYSGEESGGHQDFQDKLKDSVYQIFLETMPDQSFRLMFRHRKGRAGFRTNLIQNIAAADSKMAIQLARLKYAQPLRNTVASARRRISGNEDLEPFVAELERRVKGVLSPAPDTFWDAVAGGANKASFLWLLTGASTALVQPISLYISAWPILAANHGLSPIKVAKELGKMVVFLNQYGVVKENVDGSVRYVAPSLANNKTLPADELRALKQMTLNGVNQSTYASQVYGYKATPVSEMDSVKGRGAAAAQFLTSALLHNIERLTREIVYLVSYRLGRGRGLTETQAITQAAADVNEALGNYESHEKPRYMQRGLGRLSYGMKMFPLVVIQQVAGNFLRMLPFLNKEGKKVALAKFVGIYLTAGSVAGLAGIPAFSPIIASLAWAIKLAQPDDDLPEELKDIDPETWFTDVYLPAKFGDMSVGGVPLSDWIKEGPLNAITGAAISSRIGLNDIWARDGKSTKTVKEAVGAFAYDYFGGPALHLGANVLDGIEAYMLGDYDKANQKLLPSPIKNILAAERFVVKGITNSQGQVLVKPEDVKASEVWLQRLGFPPAITSGAQTTGFKLSTAEQKILTEKNKILTKLDVQFRKDTPEGEDKFADIIKEEVAEFNKKYPTFGIDSDVIDKSIEQKAERRAAARAGVAISESFIDISDAALTNFEKKLEAREKEMAAKRKYEMEIKGHGK